MSSTTSRILGVLALCGSYGCARWMLSVWHWVEANAHTEGSPAGLGIFAIGAGIDLALLCAGVTLAIFGCIGLFFPWKAFGGRRNRGG